MDAIEKPTSALLLMDIQNDIVDPAGKLGRHGMAAEVERMHAIENSARSLAAARAAGLMVVHVIVAFRPGHTDVTPHSKLLASIGQANALVEGTWGSEIHPSVAPTEGELIVTKRAVSSLTGTDLAPILQARGISTLVLAGVATTYVVEGTARDAVDRGYGVVTLQDCCASFSEAQHQASLTVLRSLGPVVTAEEFAAAL